MARNDVETRSNRGQWENSVEDSPELSQSYASREEAVDAEASVVRLVDELIPGGG